MTDIVLIIRVSPSHCGLKLCEIDMNLTHNLWSEWVSARGASERANGEANGPVLLYAFYPCIVMSLMSGSGDGSSFTVSSLQRQTYRRSTVMVNIGSFCSRAWLHLFVRSLTCFLIAPQLMGKRYPLLDGRFSCRSRTYSNYSELCLILASLNSIPTFQFYPSKPFIIG